MSRSYCLIALLLVGCANDVIELSLQNDADGFTSGFGCYDETGTERVFVDPLLRGEVWAVFDVIRFDGDPPESSRLSVILDACADERRPCRVHQRVCTLIAAPPDLNNGREWVVQHLIDSVALLEIDDLDVAMFRLVGTTQDNACERDAAGYQALEETAVVGCGHTEVVELHDVGTRRVYFALDYGGDTCDVGDLITCATALGF